MKKLIGDLRALFGGRNGLAQIPLMVGLLLMAVAVPAVTKLVQENQDVRNRAATGTSGSCGSVSNATECAYIPGCRWANGSCTGTMPTSVVIGCTTDSQCPVGKRCVNKKCENLVVKNCSETTRPTNSCVISGKTYGWSCNTSSGIWECKVTAGVATVTPIATPTVGLVAAGIPIGESCECLYGKYIGGVWGQCPRAGQACTAQNCILDSACGVGRHCSNTYCVANFGLGSSCTWDSDCSSGQCTGIVGNRKCTTTSTNLPLNSVCSVDGNCASGVCDGIGANRKCVSKLEAGAACINNVQCVSNSCVGSRCASGGTPTPTNFCINDASCGAGKHCSNTFCVSNFTNGVSCSFNSDCTSGNCTGIVGFKKCTATSTNLPAGSVCAFDQDCATGLCDGVGTNRKCVSKLLSGAACINNVQCVSNSCVGLRCASGGTPTPTNFCLIDASCGAGKHCSNTFCVSNFINGTSCSFNSDCTSGFCTGIPGYKKCTATSTNLPLGSVCAFDQDCATGLCDGVGTNRKCVTKKSAGAECVNNIQCLSNSCVGLRCAGSATPTPFNFCLTDASCGPGKHCSNTFCVADFRDGDACIWPGDCASKRCLNKVCVSSVTPTTSAKKCESIVNATECGYYPGCLWNTSTSKCWAGGTVPTVTTGSTCTAAQVGTKRCSAGFGNLETCNRLSNGSTYWQGTPCAFACNSSTLTCNPPSPTGVVKKCEDMSNSPVECASYPGCLYDPNHSPKCWPGGTVPTITSGSNCMTVGVKRCNNGNVETCTRLSNGSTYWQGLHCAYGCNSLTLSCNTNSLSTKPGTPTPDLRCSAPCGADGNGPGTCYFNNGRVIEQASALGCGIGLKRYCTCKSGNWSCICDNDGTLTCLDSVKGSSYTKPDGSKGWNHLNDEESAKCLCGTSYHPEVIDEKTEEVVWKCGPGNGGPNPTSPPISGKQPTVTPNMTACTQCPSQFVCYVKDGEYKWFVDGYVMEGFAKVTAANQPEEPCGNVPKPTFLGKTKGDANCDGSVDTADYSLWHKEFYDGDAGSVNKKTWHADFTGPNGVCDGIVDIADYSLWHKFFYELLKLL